VYRATVGILEQPHQVSLGRFLQGKDGRRLPPVRMSHHLYLQFSDESGKRQTPYQQIR